MNEALNNAPKSEDVDPVLYVPSLNIDIPSACCHAKVNDMRMLCPISGDGMHMITYRFPERVLTNVAQLRSRPTLRFCFHADVRRHPRGVLRVRIRRDSERELRHCLPGLSTHRISYNASLRPVSQLLEETLDSGGHPLTTSPNALRDIVLPPSLLNKVLSVAGVPGLATPLVGPQPFASPIPWRKAGVRYNNNEIYFDVVETLEAIVNKYGLTHF